MWEEGEFSERMNRLSDERIRREQEEYYEKKRLENMNRNNRGASRSSSSGGKWLLYLLPVLGIGFLYDKYGNIVPVLITIIVLLVVTIFIIKKVKKNLSVFTGSRKQKLSDGIYEGDYVNGYFHGKGKLTLNNGVVYEGDFANNKCHGKGKITFADGTVKEGTFKDGNFVG